MKVTEGNYKGVWCTLFQEGGEPGCSLFSQKSNRGRPGNDHFQKKKAACGSSSHWNAPKEHEQQVQGMSLSTCFSGCLVCEQQLHTHQRADEVCSISSCVAGMRHHTQRCFNRQHLKEASRSISEPKDLQGWFSVGKGCGDTLKSPGQAHPIHSA